MADLCFTTIPADRELCHYCARTKDREAEPRPIVGEPGATCPCGGIAEAYRHLQSLFHMTWANRQRAERGQFGDLAK